MVFFEVPRDLMPATDFVGRLSDAGVTINPPKGRRVRFATHADVNEKDIREAGDAVRAVVGA